MPVELMDHQLEALQFLGPGKILYGGVGAGKSAVALRYYEENEVDYALIVITTAKKRDSLEWVGEALKQHIYDIHVDSWNNIGHYVDYENCFFIFDEQRLSGSGSWVKSFLKIAKKNRWIMLTATPGDKWIDYAPVFIANGWYKNMTDFKSQHVIYSPYVKFPQILRYVGEAKLEKLRNGILVEMPYINTTERVLNYLDVGYDKELVEKVRKERWNPYTNRPCVDAAEAWRVMRRIVNSDPSRLQLVEELYLTHPRLIVFYNFDYELDILRSLYDWVPVSEWNGHYHEEILDTEHWIYLVQYQSGAEGWNCIQTDAMILYSLTYSYKNFIQCQGRIDRLDTISPRLYYYIFSSSSIVDRAIRKSLDRKESFNERKWVRNWRDFQDVAVE